MAAVTSARRLLGIDDARWARVGPTSAWPAIAIAVAASVLMALNRFGGALVDAPRSFARLTLIGVWGWLGLGIMVWLFAALITGHAPATTPGASLQHTLVVVGLAHTPLLLLGLAIFVAALSPPGSRHLRGLTLTDGTWHQLRRSEKKVWLFYPSDSHSPASTARIRAREQASIDSAHKCRVRDRVCCTIR